MLVLSRKTGEKILIGDDVEITVVRIGPNTVRIGINAPRSTNIRRAEIDISVDDETTLEQVAQSIEFEHHESESR